MASRDCFQLDNGDNWRNNGVNTAATCATLCFRSNLLGAFQWADTSNGGDGNCGCCSNAGSNSNPTGKAGGHPSITYFTQTGQPTAAGISGWVDGSTPTQGVPCVRVGATTCTVTSTSVHSYDPNVVFYSSTAGGTYKRVPGVISGTSTNRECVASEPQATTTSPVSCRSMPNMITNTQCDNMVADAAATAATCEASCCDSTCQTWLFLEAAGCYHSAGPCLVMWQGIGGASGWIGGSAFPLVSPTTVCECRECGSAVAHNFGGGSCEVASGTCSATVSGAGCYSSASSGCDCALLTTL